MVLFKFQAIVDNAADWQLGMLYLGLSAFEKGELTIGGAEVAVGLVTIANYRLTTANPILTATKYHEGILTKD